MEYTRKDIENEIAFAHNSEGPFVLHRDRLRAIYKNLLIAHDEITTAKDEVKRLTLGLKGFGVAICVLAAIICIMLLRK